MTELHAVLFVKQLLQEANTPVQKLWDEGNECFAKEDYDHALQKYQEAIKICEEHDFENELAVLTCNMAAVHLKLNSFEEALECSNKSLERNPKYFEGMYIQVSSCILFSIHVQTLHFSFKLLE